ncbi:MAG: hypothetical protein RIB60_04765 [Phycisphaerales bacterium]
MRDSSDHPATRPGEGVTAPIGKIAGVVFGVIALSTVAAAGIAATTAPDALPAAIAGGVSAMVGAMLGLLPMVMAGEVKPFALAMAWIFGSSTRMVVAAGAALAAVLAGGLDPMWTLGAMLGACLAALAAELLIIMPVVGARPNTEGAH